jgi:hypothetical protein
MNLTGTIPKTKICWMLLSKAMASTIQSLANRIINQSLLLSKTYSQSTIITINNNSIKDS